MAAKLVLRFKKSWADEFDVTGIAIVEKKWWEKHKKEVRAKLGTQSTTYGFGTNEDLDFNNAEDYIKGFTEVPVTPGQAKAMEQMLGGTTFGIVPFIDLNEVEED